MHTHTTISKMAGWAGQARGGTDVRVNQIFTGGGGLTKRQRLHKKERERDFVVPFNSGVISNFISLFTYDCEL